MNKAAEIGKASAKGSFHVLWGLIVSDVILAVGTIFIARLLGPELYGLYNIALVAPYLITIFRDWGISYAMVRFSAKYRAENRSAEIRSIIITGLVFDICVGFALTIVSLLFSDYLAINIFNRPVVAQLIRIASLYIFANALIGGATAAFTGTDRMELNSLMLVIGAAAKTALMIALVVLGLGISGASIGFTVSAIVAGLIGMLFTLIVYRGLPKLPDIKLEIRAYLAKMLRYGVPISLSVMVTSLLAQYYAFILPIYVADNTIIGNLKIAQNFVVLIAVFSTPIVTMLFPAFSKLDAERDREQLKIAFQFSIKYASLLVVPVACLIMALCEPVVSTLYGTTYETAPPFLALLAVTFLYTGLGSLSIGNLFSSQGQTRLVLALSVISAAIGFPVGLVLIMQYGVIGLIAASLTAGFPSLLVSLYWTKKYYGLTVDWKSSAKILISSVIAATLTYFTAGQIGFGSWIQLLFGVLIFVLVLIPTMVLSRAVTRSDLSNLRLMSSGLGPLTDIVEKTLNIIERLFTFLKM
jgi:stage V sporulation protein B